MISKASLLAAICSLSFYSAVCASDPHSDFERALTLRSDGKHDQAADLLKGIVSDSPADVKAWVHLAAALEDQGKWKDAIAAYRRALEIDPAHSSAKRNLEQLLSARTMDVHPRTSNLSKTNFINRGVQALHSGESERALQIFRLARGLFPDDPRPLFYSALALDRQGKVTKCVALYEQTVESFPDYAPARVNLILLLMHGGNYTQAGKPAKKAVTAIPDNDRLRWLARALGSGGQAEQHGSAIPRDNSVP